MSDYQSFTAADLLADESFVNYLLRHNETDQLRWQQRIAAGEVSASVLQEASDLFFALRGQGAVKEAPTAAQLDQLKQLMNRQTPVHQPVRKLYRWWPAAAAAAVLIIVAATWWAQSGRSTATPVKDFVAFAATAQHIQRVTLPDGSTVLLNGNSSVSLSPGFNKQKREVLLKGTAFFQVARNPEKPFTVISGDVSTTALGTSFYIHQSSNQAPTTVSLLTGKVRVEVAGQSPIHLVPYEQGVYQTKKDLVKTTFDNNMLVNWTKGMVIFNNANWDQVKNTIEEFFDKQLIIGNGRKDISFTGAFKADQLESILSSLEFTYDLKYTINNQTVNIAF
ncbi:FecR family protein [Paraflavitalea pollutisoli]|uniref:FecR family protein n=1 Tax=Paraflavitalea pollutisoli TaxID=3034143 RepID=UPI0023EC3C5A|nr:FecR domain-containing protein [Paraflavitalea sp. H1-2-19X]